MKRQPTLAERGITERVVCLEQSCGKHGHLHPCRIEDCPNQRFTRALGYCRKHHRRWERHGDALGGRSYRRRLGYCGWTGCNRKHRRIGFCHNHSHVVYRMRRVEQESCTYARAEPIAQFVHQLRLFYDDITIAEHAGISVDSLRQIAIARFPRLRFDAADRIVTAFGGDPSLLEVA